jgi:hypothetical protein
MSGHHGGYENEPVKGLPGNLPKGEHILWQGAPQWKRIALSALHVRAVCAYFGLLVLWAVVAGSGASGIVTTFVAGAICLGLLALLAWMIARSTVYTLTNKRIVMRFGVALPKCINIPFSIIGDAAVQLNADGTADIPLAITGKDRMGYAMLWPHARPWRIANPEPMLRGVANGEAVARLIAQTMADAVPAGRRTARIEAAQPVVGEGRAVAA